jgi:hypothetical protein
MRLLGVKVEVLLKGEQLRLLVHQAYKLLRIEGAELFILFKSFRLIELSFAEHA